MSGLKSLLEGFGRCPRCFRLSLRFAAAFWAVVLIAAVQWPDSWVWEAAAPFAIGCTLLWLSHVAVFASRAKPSATAREADDMVLGRRMALRTLAYGVGMGVALSVVHPSRVIAQEEGCMTYALCDADHPCSGCSCYYPEGATTGYCKV